MASDETTILEDRVHTLMEQNSRIHDALGRASDPMQEMLLDAELAGNKKEIEVLESHLDDIDTEDDE